MTKRMNISSGSPWERRVGYSRAVRVGDIVVVAGTTATGEDGNVVGIGDPYVQTKYIIRKIEKALGEAGMELKDVVRTRIFTTDISNWEEIGRAHAEHFEEIRPAATMVEVRSLISREMMVEIEVEALATSTE